MTVHNFGEGGYLVSRCGDVAEAARAVRHQRGQDIVDAMGLWGFPDGAPEHDLRDRAADMIDLWFQDHPGSVQYGRMVPAGPHAEYAWHWHGWTAEGRERAHGETTAVIFHADLW